MKKFSYLLIAVCVLCLSACSSTQQAYKQNVRLFFESDEDIVLSDQKIMDSTVDLIYVKSGQRPVATMALAFIEDGRYKWLSKDGVMLVTEYGRIIRTVGFSNNLTFTKAMQPDPLQHGIEINSSSSWNRNLDIEPHIYASELTSNFEKKENVELNIQGRSFSTTQVVEHVTFSSSQDDVDSWQNAFWYHKQTGKLLKSRQKLASSLELIEITYVSRAMRLVE